MTEGGAGEGNYSIGLSSTCDGKERPHFFAACCRAWEGGRYDLRYDCDCSRFRVFPLNQLTSLR